MTDAPNGPWFTSLPPCETLVPCGQGRHSVRWEAGELRLASHADPEAELVLAALGGDKARCVEIAEAWQRHTADLTVLGIGPRGPADEITVSWDDVDAAGQAARGGAGRSRVRGGTGWPARRGPRWPGPPSGTSSTRQEAGEASQRRLDMLSLLALGTGFQIRLAGQVVAAHADRLDEPDELGRTIRSVLTAALAGRLALVAEQWLGIDPDQVEVSLHRGTGWGSVELTGRGEQRRLRVSLPAWWLARVWACGLALTGRHLVVAVERAGWPDAQRAGPARTGRRTRFAQRARRQPPVRCRRCATLGDMSAQNPAVEALGVAVAARVPVLLWGAPGTGKTSAIRAMAGAMGLPCETVIASIREPSDFAGLPIVVGGEVRFAPPAWARRLAEAGRGLLFLDELSTAPPAVQAALLRVVLERAVGDLTLPDEVAVVAAANPPEQAADGWDLSAPLANRLCHLAWQTEPRAVADGLAGGWSAPVVPVLPDGWQAEEILSRGLVAAFLHVRPGLACAPPSNAAAAGRGWPSPRTWEMAARLMAAAGAAGIGDEARSALIRGAIGDGAGVEFLAWLVEMDLPDPERVLADPASFRLPERGDRAYAALAAIAAAVAADPTPARWTAGWQVLGLAADTAPDVAAVAARVLARCRPPDADPPAEIHLFAPVLRDAGLL